MCNMFVCFLENQLLVIHTPVVSCILSGSLLNHHWLREVFSDHISGVHHGFLSPDSTLFAFLVFYHYLMLYHICICLPVCYLIPPLNCKF